MKPHDLVLRIADLTDQLSSCLSYIECADINTDSPKAVWQHKCVKDNTKQRIQRGADTIEKWKRYEEQEKAYTEEAKTTDTAKKQDVDMCRIVYPEGSRLD